MKKYNFIENDMPAGGNSESKFNNALKSGCEFVLRNKGKFIGGGAILGMVTKIYRDRGTITNMFNQVTMNANGAQKLTLGKAFETIRFGVKNSQEGFWGKCSAIYDALLGGSGAIAGEAVNQKNAAIGGIKRFFSKVFTEDGITWKGASGGHLVLYGIAAVVLGLIIWFVWKIVKKIRARKQMAATTESYVSLLSDQSFLEAKQVAYYLKENTAMSKKECNKIANFVYKKSLNRKLNNLI